MNRTRAVHGAHLARLTALRRLLALACLVLASPASAADVVGAASFAWSAASGPVSGYSVFTSRNGDPMGAQPETTTSGPTVTISGAVGTTVAIQVAAFDAQGNPGPLSPVSDAVQFVAPPPSSVQEALTPPLAFEILPDPTAPVLEVRTAAGSVVAQVAVTPPAALDPADVDDARGALCDLDGDGADELVLGFGPAADGWLEIRSGAATGFSPDRWLQVPFGTLVTGNGETRPACGDLDADGRDEIAVGFGSGTEGWVYVLEDASLDFAPAQTPDGDGWIALPWQAYAQANGSTEPALGDLDGDGRAELVVGLGTGSDGWLWALDDAAAAFAPMPTHFQNGWFHSTWASYNAADGTTRPTAADLDGDGGDELLVELSAAGEGRVQVFRVSGAGLVHPAEDLLPPTGWIELEPPTGALPFDPLTNAWLGWLSFLTGPGSEPAP